MENEKIIPTEAPTEQTDAKEPKASDIIYDAETAEAFADSVIKSVMTHYALSDSDANDIRAFVSKVDTLPRIDIAKRYRRVAEEIGLVSKSLEILDIAEQTDSEVVASTNAIASELETTAVFPENVTAAADMLKETFNVQGMLTSTSSALVAAAKQAEENNKVVGMETTIDKKQQEEFRKESEDMLVVLKAVKESIMAMFQRLKLKKGDGSVVSQVIEKLIVSRDTLSASTDINAPMKIRQIDTVLNEIDELSFDRIVNKVPNQKTVDNLIKEMGKDIQRNKVKHMYEEVGFTAPIINAFIDFFKQETEFANKYLVDDCEYNGKNIFGAANLLVYHVAKMCIASRKRQPYLALIYKLYILRVVEIYNTVPYQPLYQSRFIGGTDRGDGGEETKASKLRRDIYHNYIEMLFEIIYNFEIKKKLDETNDGNLG